MNSLYKLWFFIVFWYYYLAVFVTYLFIYKKLINNKNTLKKTIVFLENFPIENSGYQYRAYKWKPFLEKAGYSVQIWTIVEEKARFEKLLKTQRTRFLILSLRKRFIQIIKSRKFQTVIVRRELLIYNDYGNLFMEKLLLKIHPYAILDFDDDIAAAKKQPKKITNIYGHLLSEHGDKFNASLNLYNRFIVGSDYLKRLVLDRAAGTRPENVCVIPTCVDYDKYPAKHHFFNDETIRMGWIGGDHNLGLLRTIIPALNEVARIMPIELIIIAGRNPKFLTEFPVRFCKWSLNREVALLREIDIGLMPVEDTPRGRGKCGFKLIQYMGLGIPAIADAVGANTEIIEHEKSGWLVQKNNWTEILQKAGSCNNFGEIAQNARITVEKSYSFTGNYQKYLEFINDKEKHKNSNPPSK